MSDQVILSNALTPEEHRFLLVLLIEAIVYYEMLMGLPKADVSERDKNRYQLVKNIIQKLRT
jgi:hypothetical protein